MGGQFGTPRVNETFNTEALEIFVVVPRLVVIFSSFHKKNRKYNPNFYYIFPCPLLLHLSTNVSQ